MQQLRPELEATVSRLDGALRSEYSPDAASAAKRTLKNKALQLLSATGDPAVVQDVLRRFREATNMTDEVAAVMALTDTEGAISPAGTRPRHAYREIAVQPRA